jgi:hypothetical protein
MTGVFARFSGNGAPVYCPGAPFLLAAGFSAVALLIFFRAVGIGAGQAAGQAVKSAPSPAE